jgi:hypothetical protein
MRCQLSNDNWILTVGFGVKWQKKPWGDPKALAGRLRQTWLFVLLLQETLDLMAAEVKSEAEVEAEADAAHQER